MEDTTIKIKVRTKEKLDKLGSKGDTYNDVIENLINNQKSSKS